MWQGIWIWLLWTKWLVKSYVFQKNWWRRYKSECPLAAVFKGNIIEFIEQNFTTLSTMITYIQCITFVKYKISHVTEPEAKAISLEPKQVLRRDHEE